MTPRSKTDFIIVHCSATASGSVQSFRDYHVNHNGWRDIGYHWVIGNGHGMPDGQIEPGRDEQDTGAHCKGFNNTSIGICIVGDTDKTPPTPAQYEMLLSKLVQLCQKYMIPVKRILGHRETISGRMEGKTCPGILVDMDKLRLEVADRMREAASQNTVFWKLLRGM